MEIIQKFIEIVIEIVRGNNQEQEKEILTILTLWIIMFIAILPAWRLNIKKAVREGELVLAVKLNSYLSVIASYLFIGIMFFLVAFSSSILGLGQLPRGLHSLYAIAFTVAIIAFLLLLDFLLNFIATFYFPDSKISRCKRAAFLTALTAWVTIYPENEIRNKIKKGVEAKWPDNNPGEA